MRIFFFDTETTITQPFDPMKARVIEVGAALFEDGRLLEHHSFLIKQEDGYKHDPLTTELCNITEEMVLNAPNTHESMLRFFTGFSARADYICAHNAHAFDKIVMQEEYKRGGKEMPTTPWLDSMLDVPYPSKIETRKLDFLAPLHGFLNPFAHRAGGDVLTMAKIFYCYPIEAIIKSATAKTFTVRADIKAPWEDGGKGKDAAIKRGYKWNGEKKMWLKQIKEYDIEKEKSEAPFGITVGKAL